MRGIEMPPWSLHDSSMVYLAAPYTHDDREIVEARVSETAYIAGEILALTKKPIFAPTVMGHAIEKVIAEKGHTISYDAWVEIGLAALKKCDLMLIALISGWEESAGVEREVSYAITWGIPIKCVEMDDDGTLYIGPLSAYMEKAKWHLK